MLCINTFGRVRYFPDQAKKKIQNGRTSTLRKKFQGDRYTAHIRNNMGQFMRKWSQLYHILTT